MGWGITSEQNDKILEFIADNEFCGIIAPTGSGKSTTMIEKIYRDGGEPRIFISEPTIPAAEGLYRYMSKTMGKDLIGYAAEGNVRYNNSTPIVYCTSGHLRRKMLNCFENGEIKSGAMDFCSVIVLDEAHNGTIDNDAIIELWIKAAELNVSVPRLVLASATLSKENTVFSNLPIHEIKTVSLPVKVEYANKDYRPDDRMMYTDLSVNIAVKHMNTPVPENKFSRWLVFCSGSSEVENVCSLLREQSLKNVRVLPLYSKLPIEQVDMIQKPPMEGFRDIIVATNIAEASITIDGLDGVFDSMCEKVGETSSSGGFRLSVKHISKSSAKQRLGRTGRTVSGFCFRMCKETFFNNLPEQREPEITRVPLTNLVIEFMNVGLDPIQMFKGRVSDKKLRDTLNDLKELKMIDEDNNVTEIGNFATLFPLSVKNSALIYNWTQLKDKEGNRYPMYPGVVLACIIDSFGPSYYFYPRKEEGQNAKEYEKFKMDYYIKNFKRYESENDLKTLLKMWNDMMSSFQSLKVGYNTTSQWSRDHSLNNKKIQELIKVVRQCCVILSGYTKSDIPIGPFNEEKFLSLITRTLIKSYKDGIYEITKPGVYMSKESGTYFRIDKGQALNYGSVPSYDKILGLRTAEISSGKTTSNIISLSFPI